jgi:hypothetical protein
MNKMEIKMEKYKLDDDIKILYNYRKEEPSQVNVPAMNFITYNGVGHPSEDDFQMACNVLFTLSYTLKFKIVRNKLNIDYKVNPMEVDWYLDKSNGKTSYTWIMMIMQPEFVTEEMYEEALKMAKATKKDVVFEKAVFEAIDYGECVQCFHKGDYLLMNDTLKKMKDYGDKNGLKTAPFTHDIYLNDSRKTKPENLKTIMRIRIIK